MIALERGRVTPARGAGRSIPADGGAGDAPEPSEGTRLHGEVGSRATVPVTPLDPTLRNREVTTKRAADREPGEPWLEVTVSTALASAGHGRPSGKNCARGRHEGRRIRGTLREVTLEHRVYGDPEGEPVLWIHGALVSGWMWHPQLEALPDYRSVVVDLPGHGGSHGIEWISFDDTAMELVAVLDELGIDQRAHVVGMSLGAITGLHLLASAPERVGRAVLTGALARPLSRWMTWASLAVGALTQLPGAEGLVARALKLPAEAREGFHEAGLALDRRSFFRINDQLLGDFLPPGLGRIEAPTLLLAGAEEQALTIESQRVLEQRLPHAEARLAPGCHHAWSGERPELFSATVDAWLMEDELPPELEPL